MLIRTHMEELKEETNDVLYERYRTSKLTTMGVTQDSSVFKEVKCVCTVFVPADRAAPPPSWPRSARCTMPVSPRCAASHCAGLTCQMEAEMKMVFQQKVNEKARRSLRCHRSHRAGGQAEAVRGGAGA